MKRLLVLFIILSSTVSAQSLVQFKSCRAINVLTFLQAASGDTRHASTSFRDSIHLYTSHIDSARFRRLIDDFRALDLDHSYTIAGYPEGRQHPRTTLDLLMINAVHANSIKDFLDRIIGILPNEAWLKLSQIMYMADPIYDKMIWSANQQSAQNIIATLNTYDNRLDDIFNRLNRFYGSTWTKDIPFTVAAYPIPGKKGNTTATPHSNSLVMAVLTQETDIDMRVGVAIHEMCHVLYGEQPIALQEKIDRWFTTSKNPNRRFAYNYIDEGLATACGNAWAYEQLTGKTDSSQWYNDEYINAYAHALYPLVRTYMNTARTIDSAFIAQAIAIFSQQFPDAYLNYNNLFNSVNFYTDAASDAEFKEISGMLNTSFRISSSYNSYPIAESMQQLDAAKGTQLFIVHTNNASVLQMLSTRFPELKNGSSAKEGVTSFFDKQKRPVIVVNVKNKSHIKKALTAIANAKTINVEKNFIPLE